MNIIKEIVNYNFKRNRSMGAIGYVLDVSPNSQMILLLKSDDPHYCIEKMIETERHPKFVGWISHDIEDKRTTLYSNLKLKEEFLAIPHEEVQWRWVIANKDKVFIVMDAYFTYMCIKNPKAETILSDEYMAKDENGEAPEDYFVGNYTFLHPCVIKNVEELGSWYNENQDLCGKQNIKFIYQLDDYHKNLFKKIKKNNYIDVLIKVF